MVRQREAEACGIRITGPGTYSVVERRFGLVDNSIDHYRERLHRAPAFRFRGTRSVAALSAHRNAIAKSTNKLRSPAATCDGTISRSLARPGRTGYLGI
jgi:hypothetical protein